MRIKNVFGRSEPTLSEDERFLENVASVSEMHLSTAACIYKCEVKKKKNLHPSVGTKINGTPF